MKSMIIPTLFVICRKSRNIPFLIFLCFCVTFTGKEFSETRLYAEDANPDQLASKHMSYLINSGRGDLPFVLTQPYSSHALSMSPDDKVFPRLLGPMYHPKDDSGFFLGFIAADKVKVLDDKVVNRYRGDFYFRFDYPHITLVNRTTVNEEYKYDPFYAGDLSESEHWLYGRVNEAYVDVHFEHFNFFLGRMKRNWGAPNIYSLMLSDHAYTYDHMLVSYQNKHLKLSVIFARLEDSPAIGLNNVDEPENLIYYENARRYLVGHRLDLNISKNFKIALTEMATYGGPDRDFDLSFLNPMTFYYGLQRNDVKQMNGNWTIDLFYKPIPRMSFYCQFLIDDPVVNNEPGLDERAMYPDRLAGMLSIRSGDLIVKGLNTELTYVRVWNQTYQSQWTWENYHHRGLGLGYPCAACEEVIFSMDYWNLFPWFFSNEFIIGRYGDAALTDVFTLKKLPFPVAPVTDNILNRFTVQYFMNEKIRFNLRVEYYKDPSHYLNRLNEGANFTLSLGFQYWIGTKLF